MIIIFEAELNQKYLICVLTKLASLVIIIISKKVDVRSGDND